MPLLHVIESIFVFFLMVAWVWVVIRVIADVFISKDLGGLAKGLWSLFIIVIPWFGVLCYLIFRGRGMENRSGQAQAEAAEMRHNYIQNVASSSTADELFKLAELKDKGVITDTEFAAQKAKLLS